MVTSITVSEFQDKWKLKFSAHEHHFDNRHSHQKWLCRIPQLGIFCVLLHNFHTPSNRYRNTRRGKNIKFLHCDDGLGIANESNFYMVSTTYKFGNSRRLVKEKITVAGNEEWCRVGERAIQISSISVVGALFCEIIGTSCGENVISSNGHYRRTRK